MNTKMTGGRERVSIPTSTPNPYAADGSSGDGEREGRIGLTLGS